MTLSTTCYFCQSDLVKSDNESLGDLVCRTCSPTVYSGWGGNVNLAATISKNGFIYDFFALDMDGESRLYIYSNVGIGVFSLICKVSSAQELEKLGDRYTNLKAFL